MKPNIVFEAECPKCGSNNFHIVITAKSIPWEKIPAVTIVGGLIDDNGLELTAVMDIPREEQDSYLLCDDCGYMWAVNE